MGPVSFGAALIVAPKSINGSLNVTFLSWSTVRQVLRVGTWGVMFTSRDTGRHGFSNWGT
jgi:hypothetical protein